MLLDSHSLLWLADDTKNHSLGKNAKRAIENSKIVYFSSVSIAELTIKSMLGKLRLQSSLSEQAIEHGIVQLNLSAQHAAEIRSFPSLTRHDPFDRMLLAQASTENLTFITADTTILALGLPYVLDARV